MAKTLCKWKKREIENRFEKVVSLIVDPKYICQGCARSSNNKHSLCKPKKIQS